MGGNNLFSQAPLKAQEKDEENCQIQAVELDPIAAKQAQENINDSVWKNRIQLIQTDIQHFLQTTEQTFDLIVANPPYFEQCIACKNE